MMANLGDSRIYAVLESGLAQITGDQNVRGTKLRLHQPQWNSRDGAALVGHLGRFVPGENNQWIDDLPHPDFFTINLLPGEGLLFCSDGSHRLYQQQLPHYASRTRSHWMCQRQSDDNMCAEASTNSIPCLISYPNELGVSKVVTTSVYFRLQSIDHDWAALIDIYIKRDRLTST